MKRQFDLKYSVFNGKFDRNRKATIEARNIWAASREAIRRAEQLAPARKRVEEVLYKVKPHKPIFFKDSK